MDIVLTQGQVAKIDDADWHLVSGYKWFAKRDQDGRWYASTNAWCPLKRKRITLSMHRVIVNAHSGDFVDHKDSTETLDNRRRNIRVCTNALNQQNTGSRGGKSIFKGVSWNTQKGRWKVAFRCNGVFHFVGYFTDEIEAARAYDVAVLPLAGEFARLNFPKSA